MEYQISEVERKENFDEFYLNSICCNHNNKWQTNKNTKVLGSGSLSEHRQDKLFVISLMQEQSKMILYQALSEPDLLI